MNFLKKIFKATLPYDGIRLLRLLRDFFSKVDDFVSPRGLKKAENFIERYREIVSDPLNLFIERVPEAGYLNEQKQVILHNGNVVPVFGEYAYYEDFSDILIINRGVHEPLEEFCFQEFLKIDPLSENINVIELGAYWGHYSMWFQKHHPNANCFLVEPDPHNIEVGKNNFLLNGFEGDFINAFVSSESFTVDGFMKEKGIENLYLLHSDIQGYELVMLQNASDSLKQNKIEYIFVSTHAYAIHQGCNEILKKHMYVIEVDSEPNQHTTSNDGFILARRESAAPVFKSFRPMGRVDIAKAKSQELLGYLVGVQSN